MENLTFRGPCIVIYSYNKIQRDALLSQIYLIKYSTCVKVLCYKSKGRWFDHSWFQRIFH